MSRLITLLLGVGIGAAAAHFLDPRAAAAPSEMRDQAASKMHAGVDHATSTAATRRKAKGAVATATPSPTASRTSTT